MDAENRTPGSELSGAERAVPPEQKYIDLLERQVAALEALVARSSNLPPFIAGLPPPPPPLFINGRISDEVEASNTKATASGDVTSPSSGARIRIRERRYNREGIAEDWDVDPKKTAQPEVPKLQQNTHVLTWLKVFGDSGKYDYSTFFIDDPALRALLQVTLAHYRHLNADSDSFIMSSPFEPLVHHWSVLTALAKNDEESDAVKSLKKKLERVRPSTESSPTQENLAALAILSNDAARGAMEDLGRLLDQVRSTPELELYFDDLEAQGNAESITFDNLWAIFPPGELVLASPFMGLPQVFIVKESSSFVTLSRDGKRLWNLVCCSYDWNGTTFNRVAVTFPFEEFKGTRAINTLACHPLKFHRDDEAPNEKNSPTLRNKLIERGKQFRELCISPRGSQMFEYSGSALARGTGIRWMKGQGDEDDRTMISGYGRGQSSFRDGQPKVVEVRCTVIEKVAEYTLTKSGQINDGDRVMVDFKSYLQHGPQSNGLAPIGQIYYSDSDQECHCASCSANMDLKENQKFGYDAVTVADKFEDTQYLICPPRVLGYHLHGKKWVELEVSKVKSIKNKNIKNAFESLELKADQKKLIESLVRSHTSGKGRQPEGKPFMEDFMKGKGNGLVILLHGPPGVGKTLTAESVAQVAGRPLFSVSVSDVGLQPAQVEHNLEILFELAAAWQAVMLFDEADVFLESRSSFNADLNRNALVSVLLRVLEYYDGILILTTNRIKTFDIAVQSRVNLAIKYSDLNDSQKRKIFKKFISQLDEDKAENKGDIKRWIDDDDNIDEFRGLNGRQIRNILFSAASLASGRDGKVRLEDIKGILRQTQTFQSHLKVMTESAREKAEVDYQRG
ncbi:MAG: hypothetical protein M1840_008671 [Geoglossum simile]|nr:MAG: hypothetical protein M1840_008671 [Geoglossum simile]